MVLAHKITLTTVWNGDQLPYQKYPELSGRLVSEFGMQGFPSRRTISRFMPSRKEYYPQSQVMDHHNKAMSGERRLGGYILENYRLFDFSMEELIKQSQRLQADALSEAFRGWRRLWKGPHREYTSGALVWQVFTPPFNINCSSTIVGPVCHGVSLITF
jgi:beta-mannosidase